MDEPLRIHVRPELRQAAMVLAFEGWNDAGEAATTVLRFVSDAIRSVPLAEIDSEEFYDFTVRRPNVVLDHTRTRRVVWPENHFRYGSVDATRELITGIGVEPHLRWRTFSSQILKLARELGVKRVVMLGAYLADVVYSRPVKVTGFASDPEELERLGVEASTYQGPTGIIGVLGDCFQREGVSVVSLWAGLPHYINASPNPRGALALLQCLTHGLDIRLDDEPLRRDAAEFEDKISQLVASDPELSEYVKQLKRREFAQ
ncbi:MAG: PAC2 family protein [Proteobacteria bacterium]|nr:PAC2 family protein [Pseudomonadota bacterium]